MYGMLQLNLYMYIFSSFLQFLQQYRHYQSVLNVFRLRPSEFNKSLDDLVMFIAQVTKIPFFIICFV